MKPVIDVQGKASTLGEVLLLKSILEANHKFLKKVKNAWVLLCFWAESVLCQKGVYCQ